MILVLLDMHLYESYLNYNILCYRSEINTNLVPDRCVANDKYEYFILKNIC